MRSNGHCPWALQAFAEQHGKELVRGTAKERTFMLVLAKLWRMRVVEASTVDAVYRHLPPIGLSCPSL